MTKDEASKFLQDLPYIASDISRMLWSDSTLILCVEKLDQMAQDAAAASAAIKQLKIYKPAA